MAGDLSHLDTRMRRILVRVRQILDELYGPRLRGLYLYGSYARGDFCEGESDVDIAAILDGFEHPWDESARMVEATEQLCLYENTVISCRAITRNDFEAGAWSLYRSIGQEGIPL